MKAVLAQPALKQDKAIAKNSKQPKKMIGWEEWCAFPELGLPAIKAKVDTGAKTSSLHAYDVHTFNQDGQKFVKFKVHPLQKNEELEIECTAPLHDFRGVTSSNGEREKRYVIKTPLKIGDKQIDAEVTLTSRHKMTFRMLLGRDAISKARLTVDPVKSFQCGKIKNPAEIYTNRKENQE